MNYLHIFDECNDDSRTKLQPFLPLFYSAQQKKDSQKWSLCIENLLYGKENGSYIDIKLGTSTLTQGKCCIKKVVRETVDMDFTTSYNLGFTICGMNLKDPVTGLPKHGGKIGRRPNNYNEAQDYIERIFYKNKGGFDTDAINYVLGELSKMLKYF